MHCLSVALGNVVWAMMFHNEEDARKAYMSARPATAVTDHFRKTEIEMVDDFGQTLMVPVHEVKGLLLEDLDKTKLAHVERLIHNQHTQIAAQKRWQADPAARAAAMGPAVLTPGMNGPFARN
jgi:hypothetical protein